METDLGEYIIQLRHETPSHLIAPAIHLTVEQVGETFREAHTDLDPKRPLVDPADMLARPGSSCASVSWRPMSASPAPIS